MNDWDREMDAQLEERLRADAQSWSAEPSRQCLEKVTEQLAGLDQPRLRRFRLPLPAAAAALILSVSLWGLSVSMGTEEASPPQERGLVDSLQRELDAVTADANAIASTLTEPFSAGILGFIAEVNGIGEEDR